MKHALPALVFCFACSAFSQPPDTITVTHKYYSTTFSTSKHFPVVVKYWLTKKMLDCTHRVKRTDKFAPDPLLKEYTTLDKDYYKSGYDQGHNMDAYDNGCDSIGMMESFYYSNMSPQTHRLNAGVWKTLEEYTRTKAETYDSVLVWCGSVAIGKRHIGKVAVPKYCWKVIYVKKQAVVEAYSFRNNKAKVKPLSSYKVSVDSVWHLSGFRFKAD